MRAVVLPGGGVAPSWSPLDSLVQVLDEHGHDVRRVWWEAPRALRDPYGSGPADDWVRAQVERAVVGWDGPVLVVAKSLGTRAAAYAAELGWPAIWLTPLLVNHTVVAAIRANPARQLLVGGRLDPFWAADVAASLSAATCDVLELADADHALRAAASDGTAEAETQTETEREIARATERFLRSLAAP